MTCIAISYTSLIHKSLETHVLLWSLPMWITYHQMVKIWSKPDHLLFPTCDKMYIQMKRYCLYTVLFTESKVSPVLSTTL